MYNYSFKKISENSIPHLIQIFKNSFGGQLGQLNFYNKLNTFYSPKSYIGFLCYYNESYPCSYYGVYPVFARIDGVKILICQSGDTMTHRDHIGRGLFYTSAELTYKLCLENKIYGVFGFPSKSSFPGFKKKLNWSFKENINNYKFIVPTLPLAYLLNKNRLTRYIYNLWLDLLLLLLPKGRYFEGSIIGNNQDGIFRDELFWEYKLKSKQNKLFKIDNKNIVVKFNGRMGIGDIDIYGISDLRPLMFKLKVLAFFTFNPTIDFFVSPNTLLDVSLSTITKPKIGLPIGFNNFTSIYSLNEIKFSYFDFDTF